MDIEANNHDLLEHILLDESAEPTDLPLSLLQSITNNFSNDLKIGEGGHGEVYKLLHDESAETTDLPLSLFQSITNNFSNDQKIGEGGLGEVYKGVLRNGIVVCVKKLFASVDSDERRMQKEVVRLMRVKHTNIVRFLGYCYEIRHKHFDNEGQHFFEVERHMLLCFEFIPNGRLENYITDVSHGLEWRTRHQIIKGICEGLHYLHQQNIVHLDIKPRNILMDNNMVPKLCDFGYSWFLDENRRQVITTETIIGSIGYLAPEFYNGVTSLKLDIYALGVIIIEILTGQKGYSSVVDVLEGWRIRLKTSVGDTRLEQIRVCTEICIRCMDCDPKKRPDMHSIINVLIETETIMSTQDTQRIIEMLNETESMEQVMELNILERIVDGSEEPKFLDFSLLQHITGYFSKKRRIGVGGCGEVYQGTLRNGVTVAVKRLFKSSTIKEKMFDREANSLLKFKHPNIVRLLGYCSLTEEHRIQSSTGPIKVEIRERLLCLEYVRNGSLDSHLTDELRGLEWPMRYEIIVGICKGLLYLHNENIIHMDLKPANILLDDLMVPKITDFGLARHETDCSQTSTLSRRVSLGYCAPEYFSKGEWSKKSDIYSLGVIIIQLVTGRNELHKPKTFTKQVLRRWRHRWIKSSKHPHLGYQQVTQCLKLAQNCTQHDPNSRPDMSDILAELNKNDSTADQFQCLEDMLGVEPLEIHFPFERDQNKSQMVELSNDTDDYFAFFTKKSLHCLRAEPEKGIVPPRSKRCITVTMLQLQAQVVIALPNNRYKEEITVLSTRVDGGLAAVDINKDMFIEKEGKVVDEVNVVVTLGRPPFEEES